MLFTGNYSEAVIHTQLKIFKHMKKIIATLLLLAVMYSGNAQNSQPFSWMVGKWEIKTEKGRIIEEWQHTNDSTLSGKSYFLTNNNDSIPQETVELKYQNGSWYYIPVVKNQNNGQPVAFKIIYAQKNEFISENPVHDFPQRIAYRRVSGNLFASIEGSQKGKYRKQNFDFVHAGSGN